jgi:hypothetical protein
VNHAPGSSLDSGGIGKLSRAQINYGERQQVASIEEVTVTLVDDLDGSEAAETIKFAVDGKSYEIDLSKPNAAKLRRALRPFIDHSRSARRNRGTRRRSNSRTGGRKSDVGKYDPAEVRAWAKSHRIKVAPRGRISAEVVDRWRAATKK